MRTQEHGQLANQLAEEVGMYLTRPIQKMQVSSNFTVVVNTVVLRQRGWG